MLTRAVAVVLGALAAGACASPLVTSTGPRTVEHTAGAGPGAVAAGTRFTALLDQPLSTQDNVPGQTFTARVESPLRGADGRVVVPAGATIRGTIAAVSDDNLPRLQLHFEAVQIGGAWVPLDVTVRRGEAQMISVPTLTSAGPNYRSYPFGAAYEGGAPTALGGGPATPISSPSEVRMAKSARLELVLRRPLALSRSPR